MFIYGVANAWVSGAELKDRPVTPQAWPGLLGSVGSLGRRRARWDQRSHLAPDWSDSRVVNKDPTTADRRWWSVVHALLEFPGWGVDSRSKTAEPPRRNAGCLNALRAPTALARVADRQAPRQARVVAAARGTPTDRRRGSASVTWRALVTALTDTVLAAATAVAIDGWSGLPRICVHRIPGAAPVTADKSPESNAGKSAGHGPRSDPEVRASAGHWDVR